MTQTVLVTGASSSLGKATALLLKREGFAMFVATRRPDAVGRQEFLPIQGGTKGSYSWIR